jgi:hypothetical protein
MIARGPAGSPPRAAGCPVDAAAGEYFIYGDAAQTLRGDAVGAARAAGGVGRARSQRRRYRPSCLATMTFMISLVPA